VDLYMVILRIVHILAGAFWVGAVLVTFYFLQPTARDVGPAAGPFMAHLAGKKRLLDVVLAAAALTILAGLLMYWRVTGGLDPDVIGTAYGISLTVGGLCAIAAVSLGASIVRPSTMQALGIAQEAAAAGGPTPEQSAQIQALQARARATLRWIVPLLIVAVVTMASARYL
jgi:putative copper export protein